MIRFHATSTRPTWLGHATAGVCVLAMAVLIWLSADPSAHAWLHHDRANTDHGHVCAQGHHPAHSHDEAPAPCDDSACVIVKFAQGQVTLLLALALSDAFAGRHSHGSPEIFQPLISRIEHRLPPVCGPPLA